MPLTCRSKQKWLPGPDATDKDSASGIELDRAPNVFVAGTFAGTADFDPGADRNRGLGMILNDN